MKIKTTIIILLLTSMLNASVIATQNIKALYKSVELTEVQEEYILDNQDNNIDVIQNILNKELKKLKLKYVDEKNIISFTLKPTGEINKIKFLKNSNNRKLDRSTKKAIKKKSHKFIKPSEPTQMRFIISYRVGQSQQNENYIDQTTTKNRKPYYMTILRGTTRFQHNSKEYVRVFETSKDGYINLNTEPKHCMKNITLLTDNGKNITPSYAHIIGINKEVFKGKFKLLFQTKTKCNVNLQYP